MSDTRGTGGREPVASVASVAHPRLRTTRRRWWSELDELLADARLLGELRSPTHPRWSEWTDAYDAEWDATMRPFLLRKHHVRPLVGSASTQPPGSGGAATWVVRPQTYDRVSRLQPSDVADFGDLALYDDDGDVLTTGDGPGHGDAWYVAEPEMVDALRSFVARRRPRSWTNPRRRAPKNPATPYPRGYEARGLDGRVWVVTARSSGHYWVPRRGHGHHLPPRSRTRGMRRRQDLGRALRRVDGGVR
jgi:hypothetical protein